MNDATMTKAGEPSKILSDAAELFQVKADDKLVRACLWAIGLREVCGRCGGSGRYSFNQVDGDRCYGCNGVGERAAKLTKQVLEAARVKVAAGELEAARERSRRLRAAKAEIKPLVAEAEAIYQTIARAYTLGADWSDAAERAEWDRVSEYPRWATRALLDSPLGEAQTLNNALFYDFIHGLKMDVDFGKRRDFVQVVAEIREGIEWLKALRHAWVSL